MEEDDEKLVIRVAVLTLAIIGGLILVYLVIGCLSDFFSCDDRVDDDSIPSLIDISELPDNFEPRFTEHRPQRPERARLLPQPPRPLYTISEH